MAETHLIKKIFLSRTKPKDLRDNDAYGRTLSNDHGYGRKECEWPGYESENGNGREVRKDEQKNGDANGEQSGRNNRR